MTTQNEYDDGRSRARRSELTFVKFVAVLLLVVVGVPVALLLVALLALAPAHRSVSIGQIAIESSYDRSLQGEISHGHSVGLDAPLPRQAPAPDLLRQYGNPETTLQAVDGIQDHSETVNLATEHSADQEPESAVEVVEADPPTATESPSDTAVAEVSDDPPEQDVPGEVAPAEVVVPNSDSDSATAAAVRTEAPAEVSEPPTKPENIDLEKPLIGVTYPKYRPKWLDQAIGRGPGIKTLNHSPFVSRTELERYSEYRRSADFREQVVLTEPFPSSSNCDEQLDECLKWTTARYIHTSVPKVMAVNLIVFRMDNVRNRIVQEDYLGPITTSVGVVYEAAARIHFDDAFDKDVQMHWKHIRANARIKQVGFMLGSVVVLLSTVFGYFQLDTSSKGYYTGRLRFGLVLSWLAAAAIGLIIFRSIWWI